MELYSNYPREYRQELFEITEYLQKNNYFDLETIPIFNGILRYFYYLSKSKSINEFKQSYLDETQTFREYIKNNQTLNRKQKGVKIAIEIIDNLLSKYDDDFRDILKNITLVFEEGRMIYQKFILQHPNITIDEVYQECKNYFSNHDSYEQD